MELYGTNVLPKLGTVSSPFAGGRAGRDQPQLTAAQLSEKALDYLVQVPGHSALAELHAERKLSSCLKASYMSGR